MVALMSGERWTELWQQNISDVIVVSDSFLVVISVDYIIIIAVAGNTRTLVQQNIYIFNSSSIKFGKVN